MAVDMTRAYEEPLYLVSGNGIIRIEPDDRPQGFTAYRKTGRGDVELKLQDGKMNEEIMLAFENALTLEITREDYYNKSRAELHQEYMEKSLQRDA